VEFGIRSCSTSFPNFVKSDLQFSRYYNEHNEQTCQTRTITIITYLLTYLHLANVMMLLIGTLVLGLMLQRLCAMFLVHFGVNLWTLNDDLMSAYDLATASHHSRLARFLNAAASQAFVDDWHGTMKLCRRAADNARRRLKSRCQSSASQPPSVDLDVDHKLNNTSQTATVNGWNTSAVPSSSVTSLSPSSSMFVQSPRQANGRLFPTSTASDTQSQHHESRDLRKRRRFWPNSPRGHGGESDESLKVAAAARQLLLMSVHDNSQSRVIREQLRLSSPADSRCTSGHSHSTPGFTPSSHLDSEFFCRPRISDDMSAGRSSEVVSDRTQVRAEGPPTMWPAGPRAASKHEKTSSRRHGQAVDDCQNATDRTSTCSGVYCDPADCVQRSAVMNHSAEHSSASSSGLSSQSACPERSVSVNAGDDALRHWLLNHGLAEYWSLLAVEKVDMETLSLLGDDDLRQLGVPLGPRRRLQRAVSQLQSPTSTAISSITSDNVTYL